MGRGGGGVRILQHLKKSEKKHTHTASLNWRTKEFLLISEGGLALIWETSFSNNLLKSVNCICKQTTGKLVFRIKGSVK